MDLRAYTQKILDGILLDSGILSHHLRRIETDKIKNSDVKINNDEYVVYRINSSNDRAYGDGSAFLERYYININYYYSFSKNNKRFKDADKRIKSIKKAFLSDKRFRLSNGQNDIYDFDNSFRGINIEFLYVGVIDDE